MEASNPAFVEYLVIAGTDLLLESLRKSRAIEPANGEEVLSDGSSDHVSFRCGGVGNQSALKLLVVATRNLALFRERESENARCGTEGVVVRSDASLDHLGSGLRVPVHRTFFHVLAKSAGHCRCVLDDVTERWLDFFVERCEAAVDLEYRVFKPRVVVVVEVSVAIARTCVPGPPASVQCGLVRTIRRVDIQRRGRITIDPDLRGTAARIRMPLNRICLERAVTVTIRKSPVHLELPCGSVYLLRETTSRCIAVRSAARSGVWAGISHRIEILIFVRPGVGDKALLLIEHHQQHLGTNAARLTYANDHRSSRLILLPWDCGAVWVSELGRRVDPEVPQALRRQLRWPIPRNRFSHFVTRPPQPTARHLFVQKALHLGHTHRVAIVELSVRNDVAGLEPVRGVCRLCRRCRSDECSGEQNCTNAHREHAERSSETAAHDAGTLCRR
ncbi:hypothetical protein ACI1US_02268 [Leucobacter sp. BZR 635]